MKKQIALFALVAAALIAAPVSIRAEDKPAKKAEAAESTTPKPKNSRLPFTGKITAVDTTASTVTVGERVFNVTSETKVLKDGKPATLSELTVGEPVRGSYKKDEAGKLTAALVHAGVKLEKGPKKKKSEKAEAPAAK
jgi:hypothetical protein